MTHFISTSTLALFGTPVGFGELLVLGLLGVLIFGKRLPEVGRSLGKGIVEFKKGLTGLEDEFNNAGKPTAGQRNPAQIDNTVNTSNAIPSQPRTAGTNAAHAAGASTDAPASSTAKPDVHTA